MKILIYNHVENIGGHEIMTSRIANQLTELGHKVYFIYFNEIFQKFLSQKVNTIKTPYKTEKPIAFLKNLNPIHINRIKEIFRKISPHISIISQGNIEMGIKGLLASKIAGIKTISYLPFGFNFQEMNARGGRTRDLINRPYYYLPDEYITLNQYHKNMLSRLTSEKIHILHNFVPDHKVGGSLSYPENKELNIGIIGRIPFKQKNQQIAIEVSKMLERAGKQHVFHIIGGGEDEEKLKDKIRRKELRENFQFYGFRPHEEVKRMMNKKIDIVLIPSKFEGLPITMLECIRFNTPFLIFDKEFIKNYKLPPSLLIEENRPYNIYYKIINFLQNFSEYKKDFIKSKNKINKNHNKNKFKHELKEMLG